MKHLKRLEEEVSAWPEISVHAHRFGGSEFRFGSAEVGHVHEGGVVEIPFPRSVRDALLAEGLAEEHRSGSTLGLDHVSRLKRRRLRPRGLASAAVLSSICDEGSSQPLRAARTAKPGTGSESSFQVAARAFAACKGNPRFDRAAYNLTATAACFKVRGHCFHNIGLTANKSRTCSRRCGGAEGQTP